MEEERARNLTEEFHVRMKGGYGLREPKLAKLVGGYLKSFVRYLYDKGYEIRKKED